MKLKRRHTQQSLETTLKPIKAVPVCAVRCARSKKKLEYFEQREHRQLGMPTETFVVEVWFGKHRMKLNYT